MRRIDISPIKTFVVKNPVKPFLRKIILEEPDVMPADELVTKLGLWLRILRDPQD